MRHIERLPEKVINRIAAGEVVQRPSAALKELLENALDAGSTSIQVLVQGGGLELLQVTDDGHGIHKNDLPLLCERYATSKLRAFEDLNALHSFGFRGEALSSISYVARVTVTTMRHGETLAWRCHYVDGKMQEPPSPCAGNPGTCVRVEKMFYNAAVRRRALNRPSEEYSRIVGVVSRYALAFSRVEFSCRRADNGGAIMKGCIFFPKESSTRANVRLSHGSDIASHLCDLRCVGADPETCTEAEVLAATGDSGDGRFLITGYTSGVSLSNRKAYLCIFVNNRLVDSAVIKRALDTVYGGVLSGGNRPFTVLFITVPPDRVDVNIHPTKHEVSLLDEEIIVSRLSECVRGVLLSSLARHQLDTRQTLIKAAALGDKTTQERLEQKLSSAPQLPSLYSAHDAFTSPSTLVRVEPQRGALDVFVRPAHPTPDEKELLPDAADSSHHLTERDVHLNRSVDCPCTAETTKSSTNSHLLVSSTVSITVSDTPGDVPATGVTDIVPDVPVSVTEDTGAICEASNCSSSSAPLFSVPITQLGVADEDADPDEDVAYVMQQFKRVRVEIQEAIGVSAMPEAVSNETRGNSTTAEPEAEGIKPVRLASSEGGLVVAEKVQSNLVLTSVATIISHIHADTSPTAKALFKDFVFVGVLNAHFFLAQSGTTLYVVDTLRLVRIVAYQRIFLSWASASTVALPRLELQNPVLVTDLLLFALKHDVGDMAADPPGEMERSATVMRMDRLLRRWRLMLQDYFAIEISADGFLIALPLTLNACWPPSPRVIPLFIWRLAAEVPYNEGELACFSAIARHVSNTLYGSRLRDAWLGGGNAANEGLKESGASSLRDAIRFGLVPCVTSRFFVPPTDLLIDGTVQSVVSVEELFKVFERC